MEILDVRPFTQLQGDFKRVRQESLHILVVKGKGSELKDVKQSETGSWSERMFPLDGLGIWSEKTEQTTDKKLCEAV